MHHLEIEYLKELMNIAMGTATASMADMFGVFGEMHIPEVAIYSPHKILHILNTEYSDLKDLSVLRQQYNGDFSGETLFIFDHDSSENIISYVLSGNIKKKMERDDALIEVVNIINSAIVGKLAQELDTDVIFIPPTLRHANSDAVITKEEINQNKKIISIKTKISFSDINIYGNLYIMTKDKSARALLKLLSKKVEELLQ